MSVQRYGLRLPEISYGTEESPNGEYVRYADYAALQAEVERLRLVAQDNKAETEATRLQNERLRKAGDAMENALMCSGCSECEGMYDSHDEAIDGWLAAKGVQS